MDCGLCQRRQRDGFVQLKCGGIEQAGECPTGEVPRLNPGLLDFWRVFQQALVGLFDGMGGVNLGNLDSVLDNYGITDGRRLVWYEWGLSAIRVIKEVQAAEKK